VVVDQAQEGRHRREARQALLEVSRAIIIAAKEGGGDPANNLSLQNAIEKAKSYSMRRTTSIARSRRAPAPTLTQMRSRHRLRRLRPEGVAVIVEALTDNKNRTAADVRHMFSSTAAPRRDRSGGVAVRPPRLSSSS